jgi:hypothetical protein
VYFCEGYSWAYAILGSHNLSKSAWGFHDASTGNFVVRNWDLSVLSFSDKGGKRARWNVTGVSWPNFGEAEMNCGTWKKEKKFKAKKKL